MPLIECPECRKQISDKAPACPSCGCPIRATTIETTGKKWKGFQLIFGVVFAIGLVWACGTISQPEQPPHAYILATVGFLGYLSCRAAAWWYHG